MNTKLKRIMILTFSGVVFFLARKYFFPQPEIKYFLVLMLYLWLATIRKFKWWYYALEVILLVLAYFAVNGSEIEIMLNSMYGFLFVLIIYVILLLLNLFKSRYHATESKDEDVNDLNLR